MKRARRVQSWVVWLFLLMLGAGGMGPVVPQAWASEEKASTAPSTQAPAQGSQTETAGSHPTRQAEPPQVPSPRPKLVTGEVTTPRFRVLYTAQSEEPARALAERIEQVRDQFQQVLGRDWPGVTEIRLGLGRAEFEALALPGGKPPAWAAALAYPSHNIVLLEARSLSTPQGETTLRHELAHVALGRLAAGWPRWFQEGLAMYLTGDRYSLSQYSALFRGVTQERLMGFDALARGWPEHPTDVEIAYAQSLSFVDFLVSRHGAAGMAELIDSVRAGDTFEGAFARAFRSTLMLEERMWRDELPSRYSWWPIVTGGSTLWVLAAGVCVAAWARRKRQQAERLRQMEAEEHAEEVAHRIAEAERLRAGLLPSDLEGMDAAAPNADGSAPSDVPWQLDLWPDDDWAVDEDGKSKRTLH